MTGDTKYRYRLLGTWGDLHPSTIAQLEEADFIIDVWQGEIGEWTIASAGRIVGGWSGECVGPYVEATVN